MTSTQATTLPRLLNGTQVEEIYGLKRRTLYSYVKHGVIGCVRVGRQVLFDRDSLDAFCDSGGAAFPGGGWRRKKAPE